MYDHINNYFTGDTPLIYAAANDLTDTVKMLLQNVNIDVNIQDDVGKYLFYS